MNDQSVYLNRLDQIAGKRVYELTGVDEGLRRLVSDYYVMSDDASRVALIATLLDDVRKIEIEAQNWQGAAMDHGQRRY